MNSGSEVAKEKECQMRRENEKIMPDDRRNSHGGNGDKKPRPATSPKKNNRKKGSTPISKESREGPRQNSSSGHRKTSPSDVRPRDGQLKKSRSDEYGRPSRARTASKERHQRSGSTKSISKKTPKQSLNRSPKRSPKRSPQRSSKRFPNRSPRPTGNNNKFNIDQNKAPTGMKTVPFPTHTRTKRNQNSNAIDNDNNDKNKNNGTRRNSTNVNSNNVAKKVGTFRPYFVPIKNKWELLSPSSHHGSHEVQTMIRSNRVDSGPAQILHEGIKHISVATFLHEGIPVVKVSHNKLRKCRRRVLTLSEDQTSFFLTHSKLAKGTRNLIPKQPSWTLSKGWNGTYIRSVDVANICDFQVGVISSRRLEESMTKYTRKAKKINSKGEKSSNKHTASFIPDPARVASAVTIFHIDSKTGRMVSLDFFIEDPDHRRAVVATLALMKYTYSEAHQLVGNEILLLRYILKDMRLDKKGKGLITMNETEFLTLCRRLNFTAENIGKEFREFYKQQCEKNGDSRTGKNKNKLSYHECFQLLQLLKGKQNPSLEAWRACFGTSTCVNVETVLTKFLHGPQKEQKTCDTQDARDLINIMNATELGEELSNRKRNGSILTQWQFEEFLRSEWNDIYDPEKRVIDNQRLLNKPLSHYWINASYNTYSMSNGTPSVESYTRALLRGCKSIDLNCWDGIILPDRECVPIINPSSGHSGSSSFSMKNKLTFRSVVLVVRKYLRDNRNSYPIMLNLENNCSLPFQKSMANIMKEVFGKQLFIPNSIDRKKELPSPEDLRGMIVVNSRRLPTTKMEDKNELEDSSQINAAEPDDVYSTMFNKFNTLKPDSSRLETFLPETASPSSYIQNGNELLSLTLFHDANFSGSFLESMDLICSHMHDIKDTKVPKIVNKYEDNSELWRKFNETHCE